jgi:hypothetical protein
MPAGFAVEDDAVAVAERGHVGPDAPYVRTRLLRPWTLATAVAVVAFLVASLLLFVFPASDKPTKVGAILSLNGNDETAREGLAVRLAAQGYAPVLIFSQGHWATACPRVPRVKVVCFIPVPNRTEGEIQFAVKYASRHHIQSLLMVPGHEQATRARMLLRRCYSGRLVVVVPGLQLGYVAYEVAYEWGALGKALLVKWTC